VLVREFDDRLGWAQWAFSSGAEWLAWRCGLSLSAAREKLRTAHALRRLPAITKAFAAGRISYTKVRALTRVAEPDNEDLLLAFALASTAPQVEERCRQMRNVGPAATDSARRAWERRGLTVLRNPSAGTLTVSLEVPLEDGELLTKAIDQAVASGEADLGPEFAANSWQARQADAVIAIARSYLARGSSAKSGTGRAGASETDTINADGARFDAARPLAAADHYQVVVHVDGSALHGGAGRSDLPLETVRRLACDGSLVRIVDDERGHPLAVGRKQRTVSAALKRALLARDRGCSFPGCHRRRFVDAHHIRHWAEGGETSLENLTLLCTQHHRLLHEGAFSLRRDVAGALYFERRDGRVIPPGGYSADDVVDELVDAGRDGLGSGHTRGVDRDDLTRDDRLHRVVRSPKPSAEVREQSGIYLPEVRRRHGSIDIPTAVTAPT
jgi:hypothetical protein